MISIHLRILSEKNQHYSRIGSVEFEEEFSKFLLYRIYFNVTPILVLHRTKR